jgi:hypothetical protein
MSDALDAVTIGLVLLVPLLAGLEAMWPCEAAAGLAAMLFLVRCMRRAGWTWRTP